MVHQPCETSCAFPARASRVPVASSRAFRQENRITLDSNVLTQRLLHRSGHQTIGLSDVFVPASPSALTDLPRIAGTPCSEDAADPGPVPGQHNDNVAGGRGREGVRYIPSNRTLTKEPDPILPTDADALRTHTRQNKVFGNDRFRERIEALIGRSMQVRSRGRPPSASGKCT